MDLILVMKAMENYHYLAQAGLNPPRKPNAELQTPNVREWAKDINAMCLANPGVCPGLPGNDMNINNNMRGGRRRRSTRRRNRRNRRNTCRS